jgi:hypothetical protein
VQRRLLDDTEGAEQLTGDADENIFWAATTSSTSQPRGSCRIMQWSRAGGVRTVVSTPSAPCYAGGPTVVQGAVNARLGDVRQLHVGPDNNLYFADRGAHVIGVWQRAADVVKILAGLYGTSGNRGDGGPGTSALLHSPFHVFTDKASPPNVFFTDHGSMVRRIDGASGNVTLFAGAYATGKADGGGNPLLARFNGLSTVDIEEVPGRPRTMLLADGNNNRVWRMAMPPAGSPPDTPPTNLTLEYEYRKSCNC